MAGPCALVLESSASSRTDSLRCEAGGHVIVWAPARLIDAAARAASSAR